MIQLVVLVDEVKNERIEMAVKELTIIAPEVVVVGGDVDEKYAYYNLVSGELVMLSEDEAKQSKEWHIAFKRSVVCINGGPAGAGGIVGACIDPPVTVSRDEFINMGDDDWQKKFNAINSIPDNITLVPESVEPAILGWSVETDGVWAAPTARGWKIRLANGTSYAKLQVTELDEDGVTVTLQYATQTEKGGAQSENKTVVLEPGESFSFLSGEIVEPSGLNWDILHTGEKLLLNSPVNGDGTAGAIGSNKYGAMWSEITDAGDSVAYFMDEYGSLLRSPKWYRYNIDGTHKIHPNGAVYGLRTADGDFKIQIFEYSGVGNMRVRYELF